MRNNNPGNIRHSSSHWQGQSEAQPDPAFVSFDAMYWGVRALGRLLQTYQSKYGLHTIQAIIGRWAPPTENNTVAYVNAVAGYMKAKGTSVVTLSSYHDLALLATAIIIHENGLTAVTIKNISSDIDKGIRLCIPTGPA